MPVTKGPGMTSRQATLGKPVELQGVGLHSGQTTRLRISPAPADHGVVFVRTDLGPEARVPATLAYKADRPRRTAIRNGDAEVHTVEHLMAPLVALAIDNALVEIDGIELPGLDGSGLDYLTALEGGGRVELDAPARVLKLPRVVAVSSPHASAVALPADHFGVSYTLKYSSPHVPVQFYSGLITAETFKREIAGARTFCLRQEVEALQAAGLGRGANLQNTLVIGDDGLPIENRLRFEDEFVRHKVLDLIGDLALLGQRLHAHVIGVRSGHALNAALVREILAAAGGGAQLDAPSGCIRADETLQCNASGMWLLDRLAALGAQLAGNGAPAELRAVEQAHFKRAGREGEQLSFNVHLLADEPGNRCLGTVRVGEESLAEARFAFAEPAGGGP